MSASFDSLETHDIVWCGISIRITFVPRFLGGDEASPYDLAHLQIESLQPARAPLPVTETGYRSHFTQLDAIAACGGPVAYAIAWLDRAAKAPNWKAAQIKGTQLSLF